ncbi:hypothetical protein [Paraburkholderia sp. J41]|uniref:hypothetical protein n=1 Tax=Paraburkholderia sp. J41 TaxID=2805433 RepID=UPI002AC33330|nr:hypothetical protein [Paraburkholderia sp. J41]
MYQRTVTRSIWADNKRAYQYWRYKGEVGYDMSKEPPAPLMSAKDVNRPSSFPLSALPGLRRQPDINSQDVAEKVAETSPIVVMSRNNLEQAGGKMLRIPDVVVLKSTGHQASPLYEALKAAGDPDRPEYLESGRPGIGPFIPVQANIERIVEVKFENDTYSEGQELAYRYIAGPAEFNILEPEHPDPALSCRCKEKRKQPQEKPVTVPDRAPSRKSSRKNIPVPVPEAEPVPVPEGEPVPAPKPKPAPQPEPAPVPAPARVPIRSPNLQSARPIQEALQDTPTTNVGGWAVVVIGGLILVRVLAVVAAPETGGASLVLLAL